MAEETQTTSTVPAGIFLTGAETGLGLAIVRQLTQAGHRVLGAVATGTAGALAVRQAGGIPAYTDLTRPGEIRSALTGSRTTTIIHAAPVRLNGVPHTFPADVTPELDWLQRSADSLASAAGQSGIQRIISLSFAVLYGDQGGATVDENTTISRDEAFFRAAEQAEASILDGAVPGYVLRSGFVYGGSDNAFKALADNIVKGHSVLPGAGRRAWIYEDDLASAIRHLAGQAGDAGTATLYNVASDDAATPDAFIDALGQALGIGAVPKGRGGLPIIGRDDILRDHLLAHSAVVSSQKLREATGWTPQYNSIVAGLERALLIWRAGTEPVTPAASREIVKA